MFFIAGSSGNRLAESLSRRFQKGLISRELTLFKCGEIKVSVSEKLLGQKIALVQSIAYPTHENFMELLLIADAIKRQAVKELILIVPYLSYNRQNRISSEGECLSADLIAKIIQTVSPTLMLTLDLHSPSTVGFFDFPVINIQPIDFMVQDIKKRFKMNDLCVVSPDAGGLSRARSFAKKLGSPLSVVDKERSLEGEVISHQILGDVSGKTCLLVDDMIDTGRTLLSAVEGLQVQNPKEIHVYATHALFREDTFQSLVQSDITSLTLTDSLPLQQEDSKIRILESAPLFYPYLEQILGSR